MSVVDNLYLDDVSVKALIAKARAQANQAQQRTQTIVVRKDYAENIPQYIREKMGDASLQTHKKFEQQQREMHYANKHTLAGAPTTDEKPNILEPSNIFVTQTDLMEGTKLNPGVKLPEKVPEKEARSEKKEPLVKTLGYILVSKLKLEEDPTDYETKKITVYDSELEALGDLGAPILANEQKNENKEDRVFAETYIRVPSIKEAGKAVARGFIYGATGIVDTPILVYKLATDENVRKGFVEGVKQLPQEFARDPFTTSLEFMSSLLGGYAGAEAVGRVINVAKIKAEMKLSKNYVPPEKTGIKYKPSFTDPIQPNELVLKFGGTKQITVHVTTAKEFDDWLKADASPKVLRGFPEKATGFRKQYDLLHFYKSLPTDEGKPQAYLAYAGIGEKSSSSITKLTLTRPKVKALIFPDEEITYVPPKPGESLAEYSARIGQMSGKTLIPPENVYGLSIERQVITPAQFTGNFGKYPGSIIAKTGYRGFTYYVQEPSGILGKIPVLRELAGTYHKIHLIEAKTLPIEGAKGEIFSQVGKAGKNIINLAKYSSEYGKVSYVGLVEDVLPTATAIGAGITSNVLSKSKQSSSKTVPLNSNKPSIKSPTITKSKPNYTGSSEWYRIPGTNILSEFNPSEIGRSKGSETRGGSKSTTGSESSGGSGSGGSSSSGGGTEPPHPPPYIPPEEPPEASEETPPYYPPSKPPSKPPSEPPRTQKSSPTMSFMSEISPMRSVRVIRTPRKRKSRAEVKVSFMDNYLWKKSGRKNKNKIFSLNLPKPKNPFALPKKKKKGGRKNGIF